MSKKPSIILPNPHKLNNSILRSHHTPRKAAFGNNNIQPEEITVKARNSVLTLKSDGELTMKERNQLSSGMYLLRNKKTNSIIPYEDIETVSQQLITLKNGTQITASEIRTEYDFINPPTTLSLIGGKSKKSRKHKSKSKKSHKHKTRKHHRK
jgi:hypothetical protein